MEGFPPFALERPEQVLVGAAACRTTKPVVLLVRTLLGETPLTLNAKPAEKRMLKYMVNVTQMSKMSVMSVMLVKYFVTVAKDVFF